MVTLRVIRQSSIDCTAGCSTEIFGRQTPGYMELSNSTMYLQVVAGLRVIHRDQFRHLWVILDHLKPLLEGACQ